MKGLSSTLDPTLARRLLEELGAEARGYRFEVAPNPCVGAAVLSYLVTMTLRRMHRTRG